MFDNLTQNNIVESEEEGLEFLPMREGKYRKESYPKASLWGKFKVKEEGEKIIVQEVKYAAIFWSIIILGIVVSGILYVVIEEGVSSLYSIEAIVSIVIFGYYSRNVFIEAFEKSSTLVINKLNMTVSLDDAVFSASEINVVRVVKYCVWKNCFYQPYMKLKGDGVMSGAILKRVRFSRKFNTYIANEINNMIDSKHFVDSKLDAKDFLLGYLIYYVLIAAILGAVVWSLFLS